MMSLKRALSWVPVNFIEVSTETFSFRAEIMRHCGQVKHGPES
jgi:hypothetical protein